MNCVCSELKLCMHKDGNKNPFCQIYKAVRTFMWTRTLSAVYINPSVCSSLKRIAGALAKSSLHMAQTV